MDELEPVQSLLNVIQVEDGGKLRHLVCFLGPEHAGTRGIDERSIVGEYEPGPDDVFDLESFVLNSAFVDALIQFMNERTAFTPELKAEASRQAGGMLYLIDPRAHETTDEEPAARDVIGAFVVDPEGTIVPGSFRYNEDHEWFDEDDGISGVFADRAFYDWLHAETGPTS